LTFIFSHCVIFSRFLTIKYMHTSHYLVMWHWWTFIQINYKVIQLISFVTTSNTCVNEDERKFIKNSGKNQIEWESEWFYCCSSRHCYQKILNMLVTMIHTRKKNQHLWRKTRHASSPVDVVSDLRPCLIKRKTTLFLYNGCSIQENEQEEQIVCVWLRVAWIEL
jgi:hypothetical protein